MTPTRSSGASPRTELSAPAFAPGIDAEANTIGCRRCAARDNSGARATETRPALVLERLLVLARLLRLLLQLLSLLVMEQTPFLLLPPPLLLLRPLPRTCPEASAERIEGDRDCCCCGGGEAVGAVARVDRGGAHCAGVARLRAGHEASQQSASRFRSRVGRALAYFCLCGPVFVRARESPSCGAQRP
eukprot:363592-Chlamydomonas_euryale.AAC.4